MMPNDSARPSVPIAPILSRASFGRRRHARMASVLDAGAARHVTSGRIAIALALRAMRVGPGDTVLVPAFHSLSMIPPVLWCGAQPVFYRIGPDAALDLADIGARIDGTVKAVMATHYFGFPQQLDGLRALCDARGVQLLEDCAHSFFGGARTRPVGAMGDYAIASSMKFFPIYEGGTLVSKRHPLDAVALHSAGALFEAKAALNALEHSFAYGRLNALALLLRIPLAAKDALWRRAKGRRGESGVAAALAPSSSDSTMEFDPRWLDKRASLFSRLMMALVSERRIVAQRRANYRRLARTIGRLPGCRPLHARLPRGVCPWVFPLFIDQADAVFARLHRAGVPVTRFGETLWPGVDASVCANSSMLSRQVLSFPCHQELRQDELGWMIARITEALAA